MNTLQSHEEKYVEGLVTESGFSALNDAESYGAASSIGAGSVSINSLWKAFKLGKTLKLYSKEKDFIEPNSEADLVKWCESNFPACYQEHIRRAKH